MKKDRYVVYEIGDFFEVFDWKEKITVLVFPVKPKALKAAEKLNMNESGNTYSNIKTKVEDLSKLAIDSKTPILVSTQST